LEILRQAQDDSVFWMRRVAIEEWPGRCGAGIPACRSGLAGGFGGLRSGPDVVVRASLPAEWAGVRSFNSIVGTDRNLT